MNRTRIPAFRKLLFVLLAALLILPLQSAFAQGEPPLTQVPAGATIPDSLFMSGNELSVDGVVEGDLFAIGQSLTLNGEVRGSLFVLATSVTINGRVDGEVYAASGALSMGGEVTRSLNFIGGMLGLKSGARIERDLRALALSAELNASVGRTTRLHVGLTQILRLILSNTGYIEPEAADGGAAIPAQPAVQVASLQPVVLRPLPQTAPQSGIDSQALLDWLEGRWRSAFPLLLFGLLLIWLLPARLGAAADGLQKRPFRSLWRGASFLFTGYGVAGLGLLAAIALGLFFVSLGYWNLAWLSWGAGLGALSLAFALFSLAVAFVSKIVVAYLLGGLIVRRWLPDNGWRRLAALLLGLLIYLLLEAIPTLGWVLAAAITLFGLGALVREAAVRRVEG